jgi:DNA-binding response OmpR family regulator
VAERRRRILIVEDEGMISMLLDDYLTELGYEVAATAATLDDALVKAAQVDVDAAILDINLAGQNSFAVADVLTGRQIPFAFATGYGSAAAGWREKAVPILAKPFTLDELSRVLSGLLSPGPA